MGNKKSEKRTITVFVTNPTLFEVLAFLRIVFVKVIHRIFFESAEKRHPKTESAVICCNSTWYGYTYSFFKKNDKMIHET